MRSNKQKTPTKKKFCYFCVNKIGDIDYKNTSILRKFITPYGKIAPSRRIGTCAKHQRKFAQAVKRARFMALLPFVNH